MIYLIQDTLTELVKIGYSKSKKGCRARMQTAQTYCAGELILCGVLEGSEKDEKKLHCTYGDRHVKGEWFRLTNDDIDCILGKNPRRTEKLKGLLPAVPNTPPKPPRLNWLFPERTSEDKCQMLIKRRVSFLIGGLLGYPPEDLPLEVKRQISDMAKDLTQSVFISASPDLEDELQFQRMVEYQDSYRQYATDYNRYLNQVKDLIDATLVEKARQGTGCNAKLVLKEEEGN